MTWPPGFKTICVAAILCACGVRSDQASAGELSSHEAYPIPFQRSDGIWGYVNHQHCWVISPKFELAFDFQEGVARVWMPIGNVRFIDRNGTYVVTSEQVERSRNWQGVDMLFDDFSEGLLPVSLRMHDGRKYGFLDKSGRVSISPQFDDAHPFNEGLAVVRIGEKVGKRKSGFIDRTGRFAINPKFDQAESFSEGLAAVRTDKYYGFIDRSGRYVIPPMFDAALIFREGMAPVRIGAKWGFIDKSGAWKVPAQFDAAYAFSDGRAAVKVSRKWGFIDSEGETLITPNFDDVGLFHEGLAAVRVGNKWGYIDPKGAIVIEPQFSWAANFSNGRATVFVGGDHGGVGGRMHQITRSGTVLLDPTCTAPMVHPRAAPPMNSKRRRN